MALRFDMGNSQWRQMAAMQQQQSMSNLGQDIGGALATGADYLRKNKSKIGKAYQKYLTDPSNMDPRETIKNAAGDDIANPNKGKFMGQMKTFDQFHTGFRDEQKQNRLINKAKKLGIDSSTGDMKSLLEKKYKNNAIERAEQRMSIGGQPYQEGDDVSSYYTEEEKKNVLGDYLQTDEGKNLFKEKRAEKRGEFGEGVSKFGKGVLGAALSPFGAVGNLIGKNKGINDGFDTVDDQLSDKQRMIQTLNLEKTPGAKGFLQRLLSGGDPGYRAKERNLPVSQKQSAASKEAHDKFMSMGSNNNQIVNALTNNILGNNNQTVGFGQYDNMNQFLPDIPKPDGTGGVFDDYLYKQTEETNAALGRFYPTPTRASIYGVGGRNVKEQI